MKELKTECYLPYTKEKIWSVISNTETHRLWNPQIVAIKGRCQKDGSLKVKVKSPVGKGIPFSFKAKIMDLEVNRKLAWTGGVPGILTGYHYWELSESEGQTKVIQGERFTGLFATFLSIKRIELMRPAYESANVGLEDFLNKENEVAH